MPPELGKTRRNPSPRRAFHNAVSGGWRLPSVTHIAEGRERNAPLVPRLLKTRGLWNRDPPGIIAAAD